MARTSGGREVSEAEILLAFQAYASYVAVTPADVAAGLREFELPDGLPEAIEELLTEDESAPDAGGC